MSSDVSHMDYSAHTITAAFQGQVWTGRKADQLENVGPPRLLDVTEVVLARPLQAILGIRDHDQSSDDVVPYELHRHDGPFEVTVESSIADFFGVEQLSDLNQTMLDAARKAHRIGEMRSFEVEVSRTSTRTATLTVAADSMAAARRAALEAAGDVEFASEKMADYEVESVREVGARRGLRGPGV